MGSDVAKVGEDAEQVLVELIEVGEDRAWLKLGAFDVMMKLNSKELLVEVWAAEGATSSALASCVAATPAKAE